MSIKGAIQSKEINDYGYARIKVSGTWYGGDKKGDISSDIGPGDIVEFEAYDKPGNGGKVFKNFKSQSLKKVAAAKAGAKIDKGPTASKDEYWAKKEANDAAKEPRISYFAAYDRAVQFADLALRNGAFDALAKAKPTSKLEALQAFVAEQALRIMAEAYAAETPGAVEGGARQEVEEDDKAETEEGETEWS